MKIRSISKIHYTIKFRQSYKKLSVKQKLLAEKREGIFRANIFDSRLKTHKLKGKLKNHWSFSITYSDRIIFKFIDDKEVFFYDIGDHDIYQ